MTKFSYQIEIDAAPEHVWGILADFGNVYKFSPGVTHSHSTSEAENGLGATRHCALAPAGSIEERIVGWEEGSRMDIEIYEGKGAPPFKKAVASIWLEPQGNGTVAFAKIDYEMKYGPVGAAMNALMVKNFLHKGFQGLLSGLKHYAETGEQVEGPRNIDFVAVPA